MNTQIKEVIVKYTNASITEAKLMDAGLESEVTLVSLSDSTAVITKHPRPDRHPNYLFEADAYRQLEALSAHVPKVLYADEQSLVMSVVAGEELDDKSELYDNQDLFSAIAKDLALCWQIEYEGFGPIDMDAYRSTGIIRGSYSSWRDYLANTEQLFDRLAQSGSLDEKTTEKLRWYWMSHQDDFSLTKGRLVHGDFAMSAIFVNGDQYSGLIDFGDARIGDPLMDLAYFKFKEINKDYGSTTYAHLSGAYRTLVDPELLKQYETRINLYMIQVGALRVLDCPEPELIPKFAAKLKVVAQEIDNHKTIYKA